MSKINDYRQALRTMDTWEEFLLSESRLPGPRANLELLEAVVQEVGRDFFLRNLNYPPEQVSTDDARVFLMVCGVTGLGRLIGAGEKELAVRLRGFASDPRWRVREAVAMALQHWGDVDLPGMLDELADWSGGNRFEQRAVVAGICEPRLLKGGEAQRRALELLDRITETLVGAVDRKTEAFLVLRQTLGYGWSVAVAASPANGQPAMQKWLACPDPNVAWVMRENLKKNRIKSLKWN